MRKAFVVMITIQFVVALLLFTLLVCVTAQGIGVPIGPPPIGTPLPLAPRDYQPTWSAPWPDNPPAPTFAPPTLAPDWNWYRAWLVSDTYVYSCPHTACAFHPFRLLHGEQYLTVRPASVGWVQLESGAFIGNYILAGAVVRS